MTALLWYKRILYYHHVELYDLHMHQNSYKSNYMFIIKYVKIMIYNNVSDTVWHATQHLYCAAVILAINHRKRTIQYTEITIMHNTFSYKILNAEKDLHSTTLYINTKFKL